MKEHLEYKAESTLRYPLKDFRNEERILKKARQNILSHL